MAVSPNPLQRRPLLRFRCGGGGLAPLAVRSFRVTRHSFHSHAHVSCTVASAAVLRHRLQAAQLL